MMCAVKQKSLAEKFNEWLDRVIKFGKEYSKENIEELESIALSESIPRRVEEERRGLLSTTAEAREAANALKSVLENARSPRELSFRKWVEGEHA